MAHNAIMRQQQPQLSKFPVSPPPCNHPRLSTFLHKKTALIYLIQFNIHIDTVLMKSFFQKLAGYDKLLCSFFANLWCTPTKQGTSQTDLFSYMDNWSWHKGEKWLICQFWDSCFLHTCPLSPLCKLWLIFIHPTKKFAVSLSCHIKTTG